MDTFKTKTWDWDNFQRDYYFPGFALCYPFLPTFEGIIFKVTQALLGVFITGLGGGIYLIANLGLGLETV